MGFFDIFRIGEIKAENAHLKQRLSTLGCDEYEEVQKKIAEAKKEFDIVDSGQTMSDVKKTLDAGEIVHWEREIQ